MIDAPVVLPSSTVQERPAATRPGVVPVRRGATVDIAGLHRRYWTADGSLDAIHGVDLTITPGEFCVIVGPSGCGKTTLLRIIAGLDSATSGTMTQRGPGGRSPTNAMVFQGHSVFPWLTVRQNVSYGLKLRGIGRRERGNRADRLLERVGLARFARVYPHQLSEGMRQRVAIARALAVDPDLLLMDEPFGALDEQTRLRLQEELLRIWEDTGKTVLFVTHSIDEAMVLADRIVVMSAQPGRIKANISVPFARPRSLTAVRSDPRFAPIFGQIWDLLRNEDEVVSPLLTGPSND